MPDASPSRTGFADASPSRSSFAHQALRIAAKDLRIEWRSREILFTMSFLAALVVLIFAFAFLNGTTVQQAFRLSDDTIRRTGVVRIVFDTGIVSGVLWVAVLFSGTVALARTFDRERDGEAIRSLLMSPVPRAAIYVGKVLGTTALMLMVQVFVVPLCGLLLGAPVFDHVFRLALFLVLGSLGFAAVGTIFSAALLRSRSRDVLLSTLLYPIVIPLLLAGTRGTALLFDAASPDSTAAAFWTQFLVAADVVFLIAGLWAFEPIATGE